MFSFPLLSSPSSNVVCPSLVCQLILTQSPFGHSWCGTECKPEHTRSQKCTCLSSGTKSISLPFGPCTFSLQRGQSWHWDPGLREQKTRDASCTVFSEDDFCLRCLVKALPLTTPLSKHYSLFWLMQFCSCWLCDNEQQPDTCTWGWKNKTKKKTLFMLFISWLPPVFLLILKHTHWMYGQKHKWLESIYIICHAHGKEIAVKELRPMF